MYNSTVYYLNSVKHHSSCSGTLLAYTSFTFPSRNKSHSEFGTHLGVHTGFLSTNLLREDVRFLGFLFDDDGLPRLHQKSTLGFHLSFLSGS